MRAELKKVWPKGFYVLDPQCYKYSSRIWIEKKKRSDSETCDGLCFVFSRFGCEIYWYKQERGVIRHADVLVPNILEVDWLADEIKEWIIHNLDYLQ